MDGHKLAMLKRREARRMASGRLHGWEVPNKSSESESGSNILFYTFIPKIRPKICKASTEPNRQQPFLAQNMPDI